MSIQTLKKFFFFGEDKPPILFRPGTSDEAIIQSVLIEQKEYSFPKNINPKIIFDIGGNSGIIACLLANIYPDAKIYSFEPVKENFEVLFANAKAYPNISPQFYGLGSVGGMLDIYPSADNTNLGGFSCFIKHGEPTQIEIKNVREVCNIFGTPDIIKIDCEGAEDDILTAFPNLAEVQWICGELHGINEYMLLHHLSKFFYLGHYRIFQDKVWHFHAANKKMFAEL